MMPADHPTPPPCPPFSPSRLCGLVLAGGRSIRMGSDKASLLHPDGRPLARRCCDLLVEAGCVEVVLSLRHEQELPPGFPETASTPAFTVVRDPQHGKGGPLDGIIAALATAPDACWLVLACDLPRLDVGTLRHLAGSRLAGEKFLAYRSEFDGLPEPLCALYGPGSLEVLGHAVGDGVRCPRKVLIRESCRLLDPVSPRALDNANTPQDWISATQP